MGKQVAPSEAERLCLAGAILRRSKPTGAENPRKRRSGIDPKRSGAVGPMFGGDFSLIRAGRVIRNALLLLPGEDVSRPQVLGGLESDDRWDFGNGWNTGFSQNARG